MDYHYAIPTHKLLVILQWWFKNVQLQFNRSFSTYTGKTSYVRRICDWTPIMNVHCLHISAAGKTHDWQADFARPVHISAVMSCEWALSSHHCHTRAWWLIGGAHLVTPIHISTPVSCNYLPSLHSSHTKALWLIGGADLAKPIHISTPMTS